MQDKNKNSNWYGGPDGNQESEEDQSRQEQSKNDEFFSEVPHDRNKSQDQNTEETNQSEGEMTDAE